MYSENKREFKKERMGLKKRDRQIAKEGMRCREKNKVMEKKIHVWNKLIIVR
jgi:hypothetical protein